MSFTAVELFVQWGIVVALLYYSAHKVYGRVVLLAVFLLFGLDYNLGQIIVCRLELYL